MVGVIKQKDKVTGELKEVSVEFGRKNNPPGRRPVDRDHVRRRMGGRTTAYGAIRGRGRGGASEGMERGGAAMIIKKAVPTSSQKSNSIFFGAAESEMSLRGVPNKMAYSSSKAKRMEPTLGVSQSEYEL